MWWAMRIVMGINTPFSPTVCKQTVDGIEWETTCASLTQCKTYALNENNLVAREFFSKITTLYQLDQSTELPVCVLSTEKISCIMSCWTTCFPRINSRVTAELT